MQKWPTLPITKHETISKCTHETNVIEYLNKSSNNRLKPVFKQHLYLEWKYRKKNGNGGFDYNNENNNDENKNKSITRQV